ncbi:hypothetical protein FJT64_008625 [Amphibalanus amphitrite]|uniref:Uncharacterized protein n=1 Tax=Amphibalanus amphitrite TaxID=1232801 RepID=A0A6A4VHY8_AMPAM|nr:hypothetical protein FJT64_008625 [Amphibalanus amphitrite]
MAAAPSSRIVFFIDPDEMEATREEVTIVGSPVIPRIRVSSVGDDRRISRVTPTDYRCRALDRSADESP